MKDNYDFSKLKRRPGKVKVDPEAARTMISLRLDGDLVGGLKREAYRLGIPYQTLIGSILHRYVNGELIDKSEAKKIKG
jgi:predicted DNA binding CopG/RHH family protein